MSVASLSLASDADTTRSAGGRGAMNRRGPRPTLPRLEERWEPEVARSVGSSQGRSEVVRTSGTRSRSSCNVWPSSRNAARQSMKCAGAHLAELTATRGTGITEEDDCEAAEIARQRRLDKKKEEERAEAAKAAERAAKMAAKRAKTKQVQLRHELRIREAEANRTAERAQTDRDKEVLRDIAAVRKEIRDSAARREIQDDSLGCVLRWSMPDSQGRDPTVLDDDVVLRVLREKVERYKRDDAAADDDAVIRLLTKRLSKYSGNVDVVLKALQEGGIDKLDDDVLSRIMHTDKATDDEDAVLRLMKGAGGLTQDDAADDAAVLDLIKSGIKGGKDAAVLLSLMKGGKDGDDATVLRLMKESGIEGKADNADDDAVLKLMQGDGDRNLDTGGALLKLMRAGKPDVDHNTALDSARYDNDVLQRLKANRLRDNDKAMKLVNDWATSAKDDETVRIILDSAACRDEARINADALRYVLGGAPDPVARLAHLARTRPKEGRSWARADATMAVRDLQVLNNMLDQSELDIDIQAWKDVGAIHMLMNDMPGPDAEKLRRRRADDDAARALFGEPPAVPPMPTITTSQLAKDAIAVKTLLEEPLPSNSMRPNSPSNGGLQRLIRTDHQDVSLAETDTKIVHGLMWPRSRAREFGYTASDDNRIMQQLMSPNAGYGANMNSMPPSALSGGYNSLNHPGGRYPDNDVPVISEAQAHKDIGALRQLLM